MLKLLAFITGCLFLLGGNSVCHGKSISRKEALLIVEGTEEVKGLYELSNGKFVNCIEKSVVRPCDSEWVTCIDDAWVVEFRLGDSCGLKHDGRLKIIMVVNGNDGSIISRFPEKDYFLREDYCLENYDCLGSGKMVNGFKTVCRNFIHGQIRTSEMITADVCECSENVCQVKMETIKK